MATTNFTQRIANAVKNAHDVLVSNRNDFDQFHFDCKESQIFLLVYRAFYNKQQIPAEKFDMASQLDKYGNLFYCECFKASESVCDLISSQTTIFLRTLQS